MEKLSNNTDISDSQPITSSSSHPSVIQSYLFSIKQLTGAETVSLFLQSKVIPDHSSLAIEKGNIAPVPELLSKQSLLEFSSAKPQVSEAGNFTLQFYKSKGNDGYILRLSIAEFFAVQQKSRTIANSQFRRKAEDVMPDNDELIWIGLSYAAKTLPIALANMEDKLHYSSAGIPMQATDWLVYTLSLGGYMLWQNYKVSSAFRDSVSQLPGRIEFQSYLRIMFDEARQGEQPLALLFVNPDDFGSINQKFDWHKGDQLLAEIAGKLNAALRQSDALFRYGGAVFAVLLPQATSLEANKVAKKLRDTLSGATLEQGVQLSYSVGIALYDFSHSHLDDAAELVGQADQALRQAKRSGPGTIVEWQPGDGDLLTAGADRMAGIFTAETEKDYRNMLMLWDTLAVISSGAETSTIASEFVEKIKAALRVNRIGLFIDDESNQQLLASSHANDQAKGLELQTNQQKLLDRVKASKRIERLRFKITGSQNNSFAYAVPLVAHEQYRGCIYLDGSEDHLKLDSSDLIFLNALAKQVAMALERAELIQRWKQEKQRESQKLREEVRELREAVKSSRLVYRSAQMESILETLRTVAPTDVTLLITGESGTGKEMLAQAVHEYSDRQDKPLITVDCGAISQNLIEAELFGHVKGAFTGAQGASEGRIVQADGGTIFLDEIGELPLDVQAKLLRFVQEKEINPVGAARSRKVDVRIVAATNRDLAEEVAAGRFRGDLYFRLQVVTVRSIPLRDRSDDILPLAEHFLEKFAVQYQKGVRNFSSEAEQALLTYQWPGNVRELQNAILRVVVLSQAEIIQPEQLQFSAENQLQRTSLSTEQSNNNPLPQRVGGVAVITSQTDHPALANPGSDLEQFDPWQKLHQVLRQLLLTTEGAKKLAVPLGQWLTEDIILAADQAAKGNARRAALNLGLAETTFRRQLEKVKRTEQAGLLTRTPSWSPVKPVVEELIVIEQKENIVEKARLLLLTEVANLTSENLSLGAALMGVTLPTYRRWLDSLGKK